MIFLALDIETTGLDIEQDQILEVGCIAVDTNKHPSTWKTLHLVLNHPRITGSVYALSMHNRIFEIIKNYKENWDENKSYEDYYNELKVIAPAELLHIFQSFIRDNKFDKSGIGYTITVAGKNAANFDVPFLKKHFNKFNNTKYSELNDDPNNKEYINFRKRIIDPAILFTDFSVDKVVADLSMCKKRAGLSHIVIHNALEDSWDVVMLICIHMGWNITDMITDEFVDSFWTKSDIRGINGPLYVLHQTIIGAGLVSLVKNENEIHPFRQWSLQKSVGNQDMITDYVWNTSDIAKYITQK